MRADSAKVLANAVAFVSIACAAGGVVRADGPFAVYQVTGGDARVNREVTGIVSQWVQGVPAIPVDSFTYDGAGSESVDGRIEITIEPGSKRGIVRADWTDTRGEWVFVMDVFLHPHHASGLRFGASRDEIDLIIKEPVVTNVYLHGDSTAGLPVLPLVFTHIAAWGPATVFLNGNLFANPEGISGIKTHQWEAHVMVTEGVRGPDGTVRASDGEIYDPSLHASTGKVDPRDLEVHLTWHDDRFPLRPENFPPFFTFFYHVLFEDVTLSIEHGESLGEWQLSELPQSLERCRRSPRRR